MTSQSVRAASIDGFRTLLNNGVGGRRTRAGNNVRGFLHVVLVQRPSVVGLITFAIMVLSFGLSKTKLLCTQSF